jgi:hypothetical protein
MHRMKKTALRDAITNQTPVAVVTDHKPRGQFVTTGKRATVIAIDQPRHVHTGQRWDWGGHRVEDGIRVRYENGNETLVAPHDVISTWSEYETERDSARAVVDTKNNRLAAEEAQATAAAAKLGGMVKARRPHNGFDILGYQVVLTAEQAEQAATRLKD